MAPRRLALVAAHLCAAPPCRRLAGGAPPPPAEGLRGGPRAAPARTMSGHRMGLPSRLAGSGGSLFAKKPNALTSRLGPLSSFALLPGSKMALMSLCRYSDAGAGCNSGLECCAQSCRRLRASLRAQATRRRREKWSASRRLHPAERQSPAVAVPPCRRVRSFFSSLEKRQRRVIPFLELCSSHMFFFFNPRANRTVRIPQSTHASAGGQAARMR